MIPPRLSRATLPAPTPRPSLAPIARGRRLVFGVIVAVMAIGLPLLVGEIALRLIYRDAGTRTVGGPGGQDFVYRYIDPVVEQRGPTVNGPKPPDTERILVLGDSITWGVGVRDWRELYVNLLLERLHATGRHFDMEVRAHGGQNMDEHARIVEAHAAALAPDYIIYQWYNNDVEINPHRPRWPLWWEYWRGHDWLMAHSYLYFVINTQLSKAAIANGWGSGGISYTQYLIDAYADGTPGWTLFEDQFHRFATYATASAKHVLVFLYPQVPFRGAYPLEALNRRMRAMATPHRLSYPAAWLGHEVGEDAPEPSVKGGRVRRSDGREGVLISGPSIPMRAGHYEVTQRLRLDQPAPNQSAPNRQATGGGAVETFAIVADGREVARREIAAADCGRPGEWIDVTLGVNLDAPLTRAVEWRVTVARDVRLSVDALSMPIRYDGLDVLDLADRLNTFDTHASIFDSHPNARAHAEVAKALAEWVLSKKN